MIYQQTWESYTDSTHQTVLAELFWQDQGDVFLRGQQQEGAADQLSIE